MHINFTQTIKVLVRKVNINRKSFATETVDCGSHDDKPFIGRRHNLPSSNIVPWRQLVKRWINVFKSFKHSYSQWSYSLSILFIRVVWWTSCRTISPMNSICNFSFHCDSSISPLPQAGMMTMTMTLPSLLQLELRTSGFQNRDAPGRSYWQLGPMILTH